jgi:hypothetical protein
MIQGVAGPKAVALLRFASFSAANVPTSQIQIRRLRERTQVQAFATLG